MTKSKTVTVEEAAGEEVATITEETAVAVATATYGQGEISKDDIIMPELKLSQGAGALGDWPKGKLVIDAEFEIDAPSVITVCTWKKRYVEYIPYGSGETSRFFDSEEELTAAGLSLKWGENSEKPSANAIMDTIICIHGGPDADPAQFPEEYNGERYLFCIWRIKGTNYVKAAKPIITADAGYLKGNIRSGSFTLTPDKQSNDKGSWWVTSLTRKAINDEAFQKFIGSYLKN
jgi:hypothetical protein